MKEKFGLSLLADTATELAGGRGHYPVRRRGEVRRLDPNWAGIAWLEAQSLDDTTLLERLAYSDGSAMAGLVKEAYVGRWMAAEQNNYPRPMFEILHLSVSSTLGARNQAPCPACDNFAYTARCDRHEDRTPPEPDVRRGVVARSPARNPTPTVDISFNSAGTMVISTTPEARDAYFSPF